MKRCPHCRRDYFDDSLLYCLDDGTVLLEGPSSDEPRTAILTDTGTITPVTTDEKTRVFGSGPEANGHGSTALPITAPSRTRHRMLPMIAVGLGTLLLAGIGFGVYKYTRSQAPLSFQAAEFVRLTSTGNAWGVALSPDGKYVAHVQDEGGRRSLWVRQVATASNVQLVEPSGALYRGLTFSPDSNFIYYAVDDTGDQKGTLYKIPTLGGQSRKILTGIANSVTFSPDGKQIAFFRTTTIDDARDDALIVANDDGTGERILASRRGNDRFHRGAFSSPSWSPDGKRIACPIGSIMDNAMSVATVSVATGETKTITPDRWFIVRQVAWLDDDRILFTAGTNAGGQLRIWQVSAGTGEVHRVTNDSINYRVFSLNPKSDSLAVVQGWGTANISVAPVGELGKSLPVTQGVGFNGDLTWTVDDRLVYASDAAGSVDLFITDMRGGAPKQLTSDAGTNRHPRITPDGRYIVFMSDRKGRPNIWRMDADGVNQMQLTDGSDLYPDISPDGQWIVYQSWSEGKNILKRISINGGEPAQLTDYPTGRPTFSPDGKQIACTFTEDRTSPIRLAIISADGSPPLNTFPMPNESEQMASIFRWAPGGQEIINWRTENGVSNLWSQPVSGEAAKPITNFTSDRIFWFDYSRNGQRLAISRGNLIGDVVLIKNLK